MNPLAALLVAVLMILLNGFFVAVEFMLVASRRTRMVELAEGGDRRASLVIDAMDELTLQLAGAQLGITATSLVLGFVAEPAVSHLLEELFDLIPGMPEAPAHVVAVVIGLGIVVFAHMVFGEMVAKNIAIAEPERTALWLAVPNRIYVTLFRPVIRAERHGQRVHGAVRDRCPGPTERGAVVGGARGPAVDVP